MTQSNNCLEIQSKTLLGYQKRTRIDRVRGNEGQTREVKDDADEHISC